jgi:hypothetical protein
MSFLGIVRVVTYCSTLPSDNTAITRSVWHPRSFGSYLTFFVNRYLQENKVLFASPSLVLRQISSDLSLVHGYLYKEESKEEFKVSQNSNSHDIISLTIWRSYTCKGLEFYNAIPPVHRLQLGALRAYGTLC